MTRTDNDFFFGSDGQSLQPFTLVVVTTKQQAYRTAAWIKLMGEVLPDEAEPSTFEEVEQAIMGT